MNFDASCYLLPRFRLPFAQAIDYCHRQHSTLLTLSSSREMRNILVHTNANERTWLSLSTRHMAEHNVLTWQTTGGLHVQDLPWFDADSSTNGYAPQLGCVAYSNTQSDAHNAFTHFYTCDLPFYFVCERNVSAVDIRVALRSQLKQVNDAVQMDKHALLTHAAHTMMQPMKQ